MRDLRLLDLYRVDAPDYWGGWNGDETAGCFSIASPVDGGEMHVIATAGEGWDHVSVSRRNRCPNWREMEHIKRLFFRDDETAMQLHVPPADHRNFHPHCLHMWRPNDGREIPMPPATMVAPREGRSIEDALAGRVRNA